MSRPSGKALRTGVVALCALSSPVAVTSAQAATGLPFGPTLLTAIQAAVETETAADEPAAQVEITATSPEKKPIDIHGEVSLAYLTALSNDNRLLFGRVFDNQAEQFTLHQGEVWFERASTTESPFGFNVDVIAGDDAEKIHALGLGDSSDSFDLTQAYITYQLSDGLVLKAGKFVTLHGAEVIRRSGNFHYSRSLLFGYAIPFTHTGVLATYTADHFNVTGGIVNGWDVVDDNNEDKSVHAMAGFTPTDALTFNIGGTYGTEGTDGAGKRTLVDAILTWKPTDRFTVMFNYDWAEDGDALFDPITDRRSDANWDGLAGYVSYSLTDRFSVGARLEYFNDDDGVRLGVDSLEIYEGTFTARYKLRDGLVTSLEYRHDEAQGDERVFDDFTEDTQDTIALEIVGSF